MHLAYKLKVCKTVCFSCFSLDIIHAPGPGWYPASCGWLLSIFGKTTEFMINRGDEHTGSHLMMYIFCKYKAYLKAAKGSAGLWSLSEDCLDSIACNLGIIKESENLPKQTNSESTCLCFPVLPVCRYMSVGRQMKTMCQPWKSFL